MLKQTHDIKSFELFGFRIHLQASWLILGILILWSLARGFFPYYYPSLSSVDHWTMAFFASLGFFASILLHEISHSIVARAYGLKVHNITLFIFGGMSEIEEEPRRADVEFWMSIAGPIASFLITAVSYGLFRLVKHYEVSILLSGIFKYLAMVNMSLGVFNLIPAYPLDGGRVLRSILWSLRGDLQWATRISSAFGAFFGVALMAIGVWQVLVLNPFGGFWLLLIGFFLRSLALASYEESLIQQVLHGKKVIDFMNASVHVLKPEYSADEALKDHFFKTGFSKLPVIQDGSFRGIVNISNVRNLSPDERKMIACEEVISTLQPEDIISMEAPAFEALRKMLRHSHPFLFVVDGAHLKGVVSLGGLLQFITFEVEPEQKRGVLRLAKPNRLDFGLQRT